ncbi:hypothetical protein GCM10025868_43180 [Angustibacter aerolatus]|uniref:Uncharacterized protein n=1 Tax=Angustibacter aerolatus TaxID=1162965 RepID=A0ABQ6JLG6_9ACTN|nr:hypothetical protein GCM10025868_43180 [Angustibacter aerolatus]
MAWASRRPTSRLLGDDDGGQAARGGRLRDGGDDGVAQGVEAEHGLTGDDEVGGGEPVGEPDGVEHDVDGRGATGAEQQQRVPEAAPGTGPGAAGEPSGR